MQGRPQPVVQSGGLNVKHPSGTSVVNIAAVDRTLSAGPPVEERPLVSTWLQFRDAEDRDAYQTCKEIEDTTWVCGVMALALAARLVGVLFREVGGFGDPEPAPFGILGYGLASMMVCRYRAWSSFSRSNRPLHVFRSSVLLETALVGAGIWSVVWPVNSDPTLLLCVYGTVGWWTCGALPPFPRMATYLVLYLVNIVLEYHRPLGLRHAVFHGPVLIGYTIYLAEQRGRIAFVVQRLLWLTQSDRTTAAVCAGERPRAAEV